MNKSVFVDRDGILNDVVLINNKPHPPDSLQSLVIKNNIIEIIQYLKKLGYLIICITNQPDWKRGKVTKESIQEINDYIKKELLLDGIETCFHDTNENCNCRKPNIGLLVEAQKKYNIDFSKSFFIGDRKSDIEAGRRAKCKTIFLDYNYDEDKPENADYVIANIDEIKEIIYIEY